MPQRESIPVDDDRAQLAKAQGMNCSGIQGDCGDMKPSEGFRDRTSLQRGDESDTVSGIGCRVELPCNKLPGARPVPHPEVHHIVPAGDFSFPVKRERIRVHLILLADEKGLRSAGRQ